MLRYKGGIKRFRRTHPLRVLQLLLVIAIAGCLCLPWLRLWHRLPDTQLTAQIVSDALDDVLLGSIVHQCMLQQSTTILVPNRQRKQVAAIKTARSLHKHLAAAACPLVFIPLAENDRSIGLCTDAALYMQVYDARIVPDTQVGLQQAQACSQSSAVLFLEPLYDPWITWLGMHPRVVAIYAPNFEHVFGYDKEAHLRMQLVICKVYACNELMDVYLDDIGGDALLLYAGHTSFDPLINGQRANSATAISLVTSASQPSASAAQLAAQQQVTAPQIQQQHTASGTPSARNLASAAAPSALHIRGKSGLKHTKQLLDCWLTHPDWPQLTVIGPMPNEQITLQETKQYLAAGNILVPRPGKPSGPGWPLFDPLPLPELSHLLLSHPIHIMPSEREGFGHAINEGRAAGALLVVPDHPPMKELVLPGSGVLIRPTARFSHQDDPVPVLGKYANISVSVSPENICEAVSHALSISPEQRIAMGAKARQLFEQGRRDFEQRAKYVKVVIKHLIDAAARGDSGNISMPGSPVSGTG